MLERIKNASAKKRKMMIVGLIGGVILIIIILRFLGSSEDTWICQDGTWIKHGQPNTPMPTAVCPRDIK